jgi:hypothetical protein
MQASIVGRIVALAVTLALSAPAAATIVGGGGSKSQDCLVVFDADANFPGANPREVQCTDGESCDADGTVNGVCSLTIRVCANSTFSSACSVNGVAQINVAHSFDTGSDPKFDADFLALRQTIETDFHFPVTTPDTCTDPVVIQVPIKGPLGNNRCGKREKILKLDSVSQPAAGLVTDRDTLKLSCLPSSCDPKKLFNSTFDRIQKQIFNQNCAVSGCHDSQSQTGGLLLETGAAHGNLVNHPPLNPAAAAAGWLRVDAPVPGTSGDLDTSFLYHKIEGDLPSIDYGLRMPRNRPRLNHTLREIIRDWIQAGAPPDTPNLWVPGTY